MVNNRTITNVSENVKDLTLLTPAMIMHEIPAIGVPDLDDLNAPYMNRRLVYHQKLRKMNLFAGVETTAPAVPIEAKEAGITCFPGRIKNSRHGQRYPSCPSTQ
ncbi:hypothetical protein NPIL_491631 [Nephila pilipes]|uniref:Uncharacterized protein n=1 Tax=Nephila pilipes TaxID=299642 RepID=A0A8X6PVQ3_NEPPI|nr:hypothetical protein NPIL_491631 [Nephila pilipes]